MAAGRSLHVAVGAPQFRPGGRSFPELIGLDHDVHVFRQLAAAAGLEELTSPGGRVVDVLAAIRGAIEATAAGDLLFLTLSGHGLQQKDIGSGDDPDRLDEAFACEDGFILDDELNDAFTALPAGARVVVLADCCHAETLTSLTPATPPPFVPPEPKAVQGLHGSVLCLAASADAEEAFLQPGAGSLVALALAEFVDDPRASGLSYASLWRAIQQAVADSTSASTPRWTTRGPILRPTPLERQAFLSVSGTVGTD
jgi:hypothetical protein